MYDKVWCPKCKTKLLVYLGNWEDDTSPNVEGATCPRCGECFLLDESVPEETLYEIILSHFDSDHEGYDRDDFCDETIPVMVKAFLSEGKWGRWTLSEFLKEHAFLEKGEALG